MKRIQLGNTFFEGLNNAYLFDGAGPTTLVDTGVATPDARQQLTDGLADAGLTFADVDQVLLTHWHEDHVGLAGDIQAASDATVRVHPADAPLVAQTEPAQREMETIRDRLFSEWGMPDGPREELLTFLDSGDLSGEPPDVTPFESGEHLTAGSETLEVRHLPGHTSGLSGFVRETETGRELLSGDALLPVYTPNVGGADPRVERPLAKYLSTLSDVVDASFERALPGHRDPIADPSARAREILDHHFERTERVRTALDEYEPADAWTVSDELFGDLSGIHILHGPGEAFAHLEHLREHGVIERTPDGYAFADRSISTASLFPGVVRDTR